MSAQFQTYQIEGVMSINTKKEFQAGVMAQVRAIPGVTTAGFHPYEKDGDNYQAVINNTNYKGDLKIKLNTFPFKKFRRKRELQSVVKQVNSIEGVNSFRPTLNTLLEHEAL